MTEPTSLPAVNGTTPGADAAVRQHGAWAPSAVRDAVSDLQSAWGSLRALEAAGRAGDIAAVLQAAIVCEGASQVEALQAVVDFMREDPLAEIQSIAWLKRPGALVDTWEYQATVLLAYPDPGGRD